MSSWRRRWASWRRGPRPGDRRRRRSTPPCWPSRSGGRPSMRCATERRRWWSGRATASGLSCSSTRPPAPPPRRPPAVSPRSTLPASSRRARPSAGSSSSSSVAPGPLPPPLQPRLPPPRHPPPLLLPLPLYPLTPGFPKVRPARGASPVSRMKQIFLQSLLSFPAQVEALKAGKRPCHYLERTFHQYVQDLVVQTDEWLQHDLMTLHHSLTCNENGACNHIPDCCVVAHTHVCDIHHLLDGCAAYNIMHIYRKANSAVDWIAY